MKLKGDASNLNRAIDLAVQKFVKLYKVEQEQVSITAKLTKGGYAYTASIRELEKENKVYTANLQGMIRGLRTVSIEQAALTNETKKQTAAQIAQNKALEDAKEKQETLARERIRKESQKTLTQGVGTTSTLINSGATREEIFGYTSALSNVLDTQKKYNISVAELEDMWRNVSSGAFKDYSTIGQRDLQSQLYKLTTAHAQLGQTSRDAFEKAKKGADDHNDHLGKIFLSWKNIMRIVGTGLFYNVMFSTMSAIKEAAAQSVQLAERIGEIQTISQNLVLSTAQWKNQLVELSNSSGLDVIDQAAASYETLSNQIGGALNVMSFMKTANELAITTVSKAGEAADALASIKNAFNLSISDMDETAAQLFATVNYGRVRLNEMSSDLGDLAVPTDLLGMSFAELAAMIDTTTIYGTKYSEASTQIRGIMEKLINPTKEMREMFRDLGVSSGQALIDIYGFAGALQKIQEHANGSAEDLHDLFNRQRGLVGAMILAGKGSDDFRKNLLLTRNAVEDYRKAVTIMSVNTGRDFKKSWTEFKNNFLGVGGVLAEITKGLLDVFNGVAGIFKDDSFDQWLSDANRIREKIEKEYDRHLDSLRDKVDAFSSEVLKTNSTYVRALNKSLTSLSETSDKESRIIKDTSDRVIKYLHANTSEAEEAYNGLARISERADTDLIKEAFATGEKFFDAMFEGPNESTIEDQANALFLKYKKTENKYVDLVNQYNKVPKFTKKGREQREGLDRDLDIVDTEGAQILSELDALDRKRMNEVRKLQLAEQHLQELREYSLQLAQDPKNLELYDNVRSRILEIVDKQFGIVQNLSSTESFEQNLVQYKEVYLNLMQEEILYRNQINELSQRQALQEQARAEEQALREENYRAALEASKQFKVKDFTKIESGADLTEAYSGQRENLRTMLDASESLLNQFISLNETPPAWLEAHTKAIRDQLTTLEKLYNATSAQISVAENEQKIINATEAAKQSIKDLEDTRNTLVTFLDTLKVNVKSISETLDKQGTPFQLGARGIDSPFNDYKRLQDSTGMLLESFSKELENGKVNNDTIQKILVSLDNLINSRYASPENKIALTELKEQLQSTNINTTISAISDVEQKILDLGTGISDLETKAVEADIPVKSMVDNTNMVAQASENANVALQQLRATLDSVVETARKNAGTMSPWDVATSPWAMPRFAKGGPVGTDTIPAWLSPGEFVVNNRAVQGNIRTLLKMNRGLANLDQNTSEQVFNNSITIQSSGSETIDAKRLVESIQRMQRRGLVPNGAKRLVR